MESSPIYEERILHAANVWYACHRSPSARPCDEIRCPKCWEGVDLQHDFVRCSRFKHNVPPKASSGLGRLKGGNVRHAANGGPTPRAWAVGDEAGEDVEIFRNPHARRNDLTGDGRVTLAKILYFFDHRGNRRPGHPVDEGGPMMEYVLVFEYVTCGAGRSTKPDSVTKHPTYYLQGNAGTRPSVFPVDAIRRHVHMYHLCPHASFSYRAMNEGSSGVHRRGTFDTNRGESDTPSRCGLRRATAGDGGGLVWKHHFFLAHSNSNIRQRDIYMLNEHWHSAFQDGVI